MWNKLNIVNDHKAHKIHIKGNVKMTNSPSLYHLLLIIFRDTSRSQNQKQTECATEQHTTGIAAATVAKFSTSTVALRPAQSSAECVVSARHQKDHAGVVHAYRLDDLEPNCRSKQTLAGKLSSENLERTNHCPFASTRHFLSSQITGKTTDKGSDYVGIAKSPLENESRDPGETSSCSWNLCAKNAS